MTARLQSTAGLFLVSLFACGGVVKNGPSPTGTAGSTSPEGTTSGGDNVVGGTGGSTAGGPIDYGSGGAAGWAGSPVAGYDGGFVFDPYDAGRDAPYDIVVGDSGWKWNINCPAPVEGLCSSGGTDSMPCVQNWSDASKPSAWCVHPNVSSVTLLGACNGYLVVSIQGKPPNLMGDDIFLQYFYDATTGDLVHVDSDAIPSFTQCVAGTSGSRFDTFGCKYTEINCR